MNERIKHYLFQASPILFVVLAGLAVLFIFTISVLRGLLMLLVDVWLIKYCFSKDEYKSYILTNISKVADSAVVGLCIVIGTFSSYAFATENEMLGLVGIIVIIAIILVGIYIQKNTCPKCKKAFSMKEINRQFIRTEMVARNVQKPEARMYRVDGKLRTVTEYKTERQYADVNVYRCLERCDNCGFERTVKKKGS